MAETFTKIGLDAAQAQSGYIVGFTHSGFPTYLRYERRDRIMEFYTESGIRGTLVEFDRFRWESPHEQEQLSDTEKKEIIAHVREALRFLNIGYTLYGKAYDAVMGPGMDEVYIRQKRS